jgi:hypothetical protein
MLENPHGDQGVRVATFLRVLAIDCPAHCQPAKSSWKGYSQMHLRSGRLAKRVEVAIPLQISAIPEDPSAAEQATTENVCSLGIRDLTEHARELNERLMIRSLKGDLRKLARVVYCQRLLDGHFAIGLQFQGSSVKWAGESSSQTTLFLGTLVGFLPQFS